MRRPSSSSQLVTSTPPYDSSTCHTGTVSMPAPYHSPLGRCSTESGTMRVSWAVTRTVTCRPDRVDGSKSRAANSPPTRIRPDAAMRSGMAAGSMDASSSGRLLRCVLPPVVMVSWMTLSPAGTTPSTAYVPISESRSNSNERRSSAAPRRARVRTTARCSVSMAGTSTDMTSSKRNPSPIVSSRDVARPTGWSFIRTR